MRPSVFRPSALLLCTLAIACGGDDDDGDDGGGAGDAGMQEDAAPRPDASGDRTTGFVPARAGAIELHENTRGGTQVGARLLDRTEQPAVTLLVAEGACEVWSHARPGDCDPPCGDGYCTPDGTCEPYAAPSSAGTITVDGLRDPLQFVPSDFGYLSDPEFPPEDLFEPGAAITASAPGADAPGFELSVEAVAPLEADLDLDFDITLVIEDGVDEEIRWTPAGGGTIQLALLVGHHGAPWEAILVCESEDDGELVIPGAVVEQFPRASSGLEQHPSSLARLARDVADTPAGPVELVAASVVLIPQIEHR